MLVEILYVAGCPNYQPALARLRRALKTQAISSPIREIRVDDDATAQALRFPGSPTIRINGLDADPGNETAVGISCRLYAGGAEVPSEEAIERAILAATRQGEKS